MSTSANSIVEKSQALEVTSEYPSEQGHRLVAATDIFFGTVAPTRPSPAITTNSTYFTISRTEPEKRESFPPAYFDVEDSDLPRYEEPNTLARQLFIFGFLFFPFWFIGVSIIFTKLHTTSKWAGDMTSTEQEKMLDVLRRAELKWAWRCLYAIFLLGFAVASVVCIIKFSVLRAF